MVQLDVSPLSQLDADPSTEQTIDALIKEARRRIRR
jgi:hypothetical protein